MHMLHLRTVFVIYANSFYAFLPIISDGVKSPQVEATLAHISELVFGKLTAPVVILANNVFGKFRAISSKDVIKIYNIFDFI